MANRPQEVWLMCLPGYWDRLGWTDSAVPLVVWSCPTKVDLKEFSMIKRDAVTLDKSMNWQNYLTIRLQARVFYEQIVNEAQLTIARRKRGRVV